MMRKGTITELDPYDSLGWIELEDGERVRFGGTALSGFQAYPAPGTRVWVEDVAPGFRGVLKATRVLPWLAEQSNAPPVAPLPPEIPWGDFVEMHPRWSDLDEVWLRPELHAAALELPAHPLFAPWHQQIVDSTPIIAPLRVPDWRSPNVCDPEPFESFAHGLVAYLEEPHWPTCGRCAQPLEHCIQLAPAVMLPWGGAGRGFVAMYCFECGIQHREAPGVSFSAFIEPRVRVTRAPGKSASSTPMLGSRRVETRTPARQPHNTLWYRYRSEITPDTAASALFGYDQSPTLSSLPEFWVGSSDAEDYELPLDSEAVLQLFEDWMAHARGTAGWSGAALGGAPNWDQADATPSCHGAMRQLLEYEGGQFLDGALHVFQCLQCGALRSVAEF